MKDDEDSSVVIMEKWDYVTKLDTIIDDCIMKGTYVETADNTLKELLWFQDFMYRNFHNYEHYKDMLPDCNQPAHLYGEAKTHKFENLEDITVASLKFRSIIDQTGTFTYNVAKVVPDYFRPLCKNEYSINDIQKFPSISSSISPLWDDDEDVSYNIKSLFTNILIEETINYITEQIYVHKRLTPICSKLIFRRLLIKLATDCTFEFNSRFLKQLDDCTMEWPLSVTFSDIYKVKMENDVVIPSKPFFYCRFVEDIYSRQKLGDDVLFDRLSNYHSNIKLTIEVNPNCLP